MRPALRRSGIVPHGWILLIFGAAAGCGDDAGSRTTGPQDARQVVDTGQKQATADAQPDATPPDEERRKKMLLNREELEEMLGRPNVRIVDARPIDEYLTAHIPGAVVVDAAAWTEKALQDGGLDDSEYWGQEIGKLGIGPESTVVVYGSSPTTAARIWWHLQYAGIDRAMLLDGGWELWNVGGKPTEIEPVSTEPVEYQPEFNKSLLITKDQLKQALGKSSDDLVVLDARSVDEYAGRDVRGPRGGHLPDATHCEWSEMLDENGRFKSNEQIRALFAEKGILPGESLVTHCQSGGRASVELFALRMAGFDDVANFYGGWSEWSSDEEAPVEK